MALCKTTLEAAVLTHTQEHIAKGELSGIAARVYSHKRLVSEILYGAAHPGTGCAMRADHLFRMASMTKPIVAAGIVIAEQEGLLSIFDSVSKYIPEYAELYTASRDTEGRLCRGEKADLKIYHCLNHTSGIFGGFPMEANGVLYPSPADEEAARFSRMNCRTVTEAVLSYPQFLTGYLPGHSTGYCAFAGNDICAEILTRVSGMPFEDYLHNRIFAPLGMKDTTFTPDDTQWQRFVALTNCENGQCVARDPGHHIMEGMPITYHTGGGGIVSTLEDYSRFMLMLACDGAYGGHRILSADAVATLRKPTTPRDIRGTSPYQSWGLGVRVTRNDPILPDGCFGWSGAYGTHFWVDPQNDVCAIYLKNSVYDGGSEALTAREFERDVMAAIY